MKLEGGNDVSLVAGQTFSFTTDTSVIGNQERVAVTYPGLTKDLKVGDTVLVDDGLIGMTVTNITDTEVVCQVLNNGDLGEKKALTYRAFLSVYPLWQKKIKKTSFLAANKVLILLLLHLSVNVQTLKKFVLI